MVTYLSNLQQNLHDLFDQDERVYLLGEDVLDPYGGAFKVTQGLSTAYPERVLTTPICEAAITGVAVGMALRGLKPIVEIMFGDFITLAADQIINHASKFRRMYNNQVSVGVVIRTPMGGGRGYGPTHSQSLEKLFLGIPYLRLVAPSNYHDPGAMLKHAVLEEHTPVLFIEHKLLYATELVVAKPNLYIETCDSDSWYPTKIIRNFEAGSPDITLITYGGQSIHINKLLERLTREEIRIVVCLPGCIKPLPMQTLINFASQSGRVVVVEEGTHLFSWGSEVAAALTEALWGQLLSPVRRIAAADTIIPAARPLEQITLPSVDLIEKTIYEVLS